jgi:hypothetical protein
MERSTSETKYKLVGKGNLRITTSFEASNPFIGIQLFTSPICNVNMGYADYVSINILV